jgi:CRISPR-associated protein Csd1
MILQALKEYYDRKITDPDSGIPTLGFEWKEIPFILVLNHKGEYIRLDDTRDDEGKKKTPKKFLVPQNAGRTSGISAGFLWDKAGYVLGLGARGKSQKEAFIKRINEEIPQSIKKEALLKFLETDVQAIIKKESVEEQDILTFSFENENELYCESDEIRNIVKSKISEENVDGLCLITGTPDKIILTHTDIVGVAGTNKNHGNIVSFNADPYCSYGNRGKQGKNAPIGKHAVFAYTTALNTLLGKNSKQRIQIGDATTIFWSAKNTRFEDDFSDFFAEPPKDNPNSNTKAIQTLFESPKTGAYNETNDNTNFYILGLSPNVSRISIRFWKFGTIAEFATNIRQHFIDLEITKSQGEQPYYSLWRLLVNAAIQDKSENIPPSIAGDFMRSIINGTPYPATILQLVLRRIKSGKSQKEKERDSDQWGAYKSVRIALIKACLNREIRFRNKQEKELSMALDKEQPSQGYQLGRLFAVLERIQEKANKGTTIRERYYGSACGSPVTVFPTLMKLKNHHLAKLEKDTKLKKDGVDYFEELIGEITGHFNDFPANMSLHEQGRFAIGYYHQRQDLQDFFTKQPTKEANNDQVK